jgi:hypothetical protein
VYAMRKRLPPGVEVVALHGWGFELVSRLEAVAAAPLGQTVRLA